MKNIAWWQEIPETREIINEIQNEIIRVKDDLANGVLLQNSNNEEIMKKYFKGVGRVEGLKFLLQLLEPSEETNID